MSAPSAHKPSAQKPSAQSTSAQSPPRAPSTQSTRHVDDAWQALAADLEAHASKRVLVLCGPSRRYVDELRAALGERALEIFARAEVHVPEPLVQDALALLRSFRPDTVVALGGGSATGLGKALRLEHPELRFVAIPTTYSGSERTSIYGVRQESGGKRTGREDIVRPDLVLYDPALSTSMPRRLSVQSLLNALAHPVAVLVSAGEDEEALRRQAREAVHQLVEAALHLAELPERASSRRRALEGTSRAGAVLDRGKMGEHHRLAHLFGGHFGLDHAALHALLLPQTLLAVRRTHPARFAEIAEAAGEHDLPGLLFDLLRRVDAPVALSALGITRPQVAETLAEVPADRLAPASRDAAWSAFYGRRPSVQVRREDWGLSRPVSVYGPPLAEAERVVVALHGAGYPADHALEQVRQLSGDSPGLSIVAPQAPARIWYEGTYKDPFDEGRARSIERVDTLLDRVLAVVPAERVALFGFSQGACVAAEHFAQRGRVGTFVSIAGARIGGDELTPPVDLQGKRVFLGIADGDEWIDLAHVERNARLFADTGAEVELLVEAGDLHEVSTRQRIVLRELLGGAPPASSPGGGFGAAHESEALPGALPEDQNSPHRAPYGLYAEQISGTGFVATRADNRRAWLYRVRPAAQTTPLAPLAHPTFRADYREQPPEPNLAGFAPLPIPDAATDFVDGLHTLGGGGDPSLRRGFALHLYAASRSMEDRCFYDADGELLLVPQEGSLTLLTELGPLEARPGEIAIIPRGLRFSVLVPRGGARGYVGEVYGRSFQLPERGPVGANGLADPRHFRAPNAWFEDRVAPGFRVTAKFGGALFEGTQDHSPFDVAAWHGNHAPYVYDLRRFAPVANVRFDHGDPSLYSVLSAPMDELGAHALDFIFFPPRWDPSEHTFRPPYFHRNAITEINGIISDPGGAGGPFAPGSCFITPTLTPHGVRAEGVERYLGSDPAESTPRRLGDASMWFQFESALPLQLSSWARAHQLPGWHAMWGSYRSHFDSKR